MQCMHTIRTYILYNHDREFEATWISNLTNRKRTDLFAGGHFYTIVSCMVQLKVKLFRTNVVVVDMLWMWNQFSSCRFDCISSLSLFYMITILTKARWEFKLMNFSSMFIWWYTERERTERGGRGRRQAFKSRDGGGSTWSLTSSSSRLSKTWICRHI